jgi:CBS domain-containing protein
VTDPAGDGKRVGIQIYNAYGILLLDQLKSHKNNDQVLKKQWKKRGVISMLVSEIMTRIPKTVTPDTKLLEVVSLMCLFRYSGLPVVEGDKLVGVIAEKDVLHRMFPTLEEVMDGISSPDYDKMMLQYKDVVNLKVSDLMSQSVITVSPDMHILRAATIMVRHKFRRIPVADGGELIGMLSLGDIHKAIFQTNLADSIS